ncbi:TetR/AcrR family transcriptional regulator C-terminal domain-containing protein [Sphingomonas hengshuiensis]|uniref:TetR/AcrR family transcriptional regulator C-terminal domain-containing protein n=1 Tax=Sphingomonas hengshuiensis TaxID=1609977 RepID=UPI0022351B10|nr:TetR/AcrR family transcriptional regulator C-terminal domain-containing protein [Sphingomonas hengshuiensis]
MIEDLTAAFREELEGSLLGSSGIEATLWNFCSSFMRKMEHPDTAALRRLIIGESARFPELGQIFYDRAVIHVEHAMTAYVASQIAAGRLHDEDPKKMAQFLLGLCAARHNQRLWGVVAEQDAEVEADSQRFVGYFLRLFRTSEPPAPLAE